MKLIIYFYCPLLGALRLEMRPISTYLLLFIIIILFKLTADQVLVFDWIAGSCQVNLLKQTCVVRKPVNSNPGLKVNQVKTVSSIDFLQLLFCVSVL